MIVDSILCMCAIDTHLPRVMMVLLPRIGGVLNENPLEPSSEAIFFDPNRRSRQKSRGFHSRLISKGFKLSGNGARGYDCEAYLRFHLSLMRCAWPFCLS